MTHMWLKQMQYAYIVYQIYCRQKAVSLGYVCPRPSIQFEYIVGPKK